MLTAKVAEKAQRTLRYLPLRSLRLLGKLCG